MMVRRARRGRNTRARFTKPRVVFRGRLCTVEHRTATYPDGIRKVFEHVRRVPTVSILPLDARGRVLLIHEYRESRGRWRWSIPGGRVDPGQSPRAAAQRELREETGYRAQNLRHFWSQSRMGYLDWPLAIYLAIGLVRDPLPQDHGEEIDVVPTPLRKAYRMALDGTIEIEGIALAIIRLWHQRKKWLRPS